MIVLKKEELPMKNPNRLYWNEQMKELQELLSHKSSHESIIEQCLKVHAMLHSGKMSNSRLWSYEDELWDSMSDAVFRGMLPNDDYTIAWHMWHVSRIEDITMNSLIKGSEQIYDTGSWKQRLGSAARDTGNSMNREEIEKLSRELDLGVLKEYRIIVGRRTEEVIKSLTSEDLKRKVDESRIKGILDDGDVLESAKGIADYWGKRTYAGLLTMPATRHIFVHMNQAMELKVNLRKTGEI